MTTAIRRVTAETASAVFRYLSELATPHQPSGPPLPPWLFRGHQIDRWKLVASLHRQLRRPTRNEAVRALYEVVANAGLTPPAAYRNAPRTMSLDHRLRWYEELRNVQFCWVRDFAMLAAHAGQLAGTTATEAASVLNAGLTRKVRPQVNFATSPSLIGLAQHHGIPTEMLDWTWNPYVALWFALCDIQRSQMGPQPKWGYAAIWGVPRMYLPDGVYLHVLVDQSFARAQDGVFTRHHGAKTDFARTGRVRSLEELVVAGDDFPKPEELNDCQSFLPFCIRFPHRLVGELTEALKSRGIYTPSLRPSLDNIARYTLDPMIP